MIHKAHEGEEQGQNIGTYQWTCQNAVQLKFEYCKDGNVGKKVCGAEEEAREEGDDGGVEDITSYEGCVAKIGLVCRQHWVCRRRAAVVVFTRHFKKEKSC